MLAYTPVDEEKIRPSGVGNRVSVPTGSYYTSTVPKKHGRRIWKCVGCGKLGRWSTRWQSYGSVLLEDEGIVAPTCSEKCRTKYEPTRSNE